MYASTLPTFQLENRYDFLSFDKITYIRLSNLTKYRDCLFMHPNRETFITFIHLKKLKIDLITSKINQAGHINYETEQFILKTLIKYNIGGTLRNLLLPI